MRTTIDKAGRIVIPASVRQRAGLRAGTPIEVIADDLGIRLVRAVPAPSLVRRGKRLVARPRVAAEDVPALDLTRWIEEERNRWPW